MKVVYVAISMNEVYRLLNICVVYLCLTTAY